MSMGWWGRASVQSDGKPAARRGRRQVAGVRTVRGAMALVTVVGVFCWTSGGALAASEPANGGWAETAPLLEVSPDSALAWALARLEGTPLSLAEALAAALDRATGVRIARAELAAARGALRRELGDFSPGLFGAASHASDDPPRSSFFSGKTEETAGEAGARWRLRLGTELTASLGATRRESTAPFTFVTPQYDASASLTVRQPLLKGFGPSASGEVIASERSLEAAEARYEDAVLSVRAAVEGLYWELYAAERVYAVQQLIVERARAVLTQANLRAEAGLVGPGQVATARLFLAEQRQALLDRGEELEAVSDELAALIGRRPDSGGARFRPSEDPPRDFPVVDAEALVAMAVASNLQIRAAQRSVAALQARERAALWDRLPQLDLFGAIGGRGLAGTGREIIFPPDTLRTDVSGGLGESLGQALGRDHPNWNVGISFTVPLGSADRGEHERLQAEVIGAEQVVEAQRRAVEREVRANQRELANGAQRLAAAQEGLAASLEQVRIGMLEYGQGRTSAFELVRLGADLAAAQQRYSQALVRAARAAAALRRLTGGGYPGGDS